MLPHVVRFNAKDDEAHQEYESLFGDVEKLASRLEELLEIGGLPRNLRECEVQRESLSQMATEAANQWTATFNPREIGATEFEELYENAF
jgi:alcohol dehydrogenase